MVPAGSCARWGAPEQARAARPQVAKALAALTRTRDSIGRATALALGGAGVGAAARIIRLIMDRIEKARAPRGGCSASRSRARRTRLWHDALPLCSASQAGVRAYPAVLRIPLLALLQRLEDGLAPPKGLRPASAADTAITPASWMDDQHRPSSPSRQGPAGARGALRTRVRRARRRAWCRGGWTCSTWWTACCRAA